MPFSQMGILVIGFNRVEELEQTLSSIAANPNLENYKFFLSVDGPRNASDKAAVNKCKDAMERFASTVKNVETMFSKENLGLRSNVMQSVSQAFQSVDSLVILEDDCLVGPSALEFFNWALDAVEHLPCVGAISGTYFGSEEQNGTFLARRFNSWGWAVRREIWENFASHSFSPVPMSQNSVRLAYFLRKDPLPYLYEYLKIKRNLRKLDSWAIPFDFFLRSHGLVTMKPLKNQIRNIGFNGLATHTRLRGSSISMIPKPINLNEMVVLSKQESGRLEVKEAWTKFLLLAKEFLFGSPVS